MPTLDKRLADAMNASGYGVTASDARLVPVVSKLECLADRASFGRLLSDLFACNDKSNLHAMLFEAVFAWHFLKKGKDLSYEVVQHPYSGTTVDFLRKPTSNMHIYYELRLLQQQSRITDLFDEQLKQSPYFGTLLNGSDEQHEVVRLQQVLLSKVQDRNGKPIKFFSVDSPNYNVLVVDVTQPLLGMIDKYGCILACYGDEAVPPHCRRDVFGLFQILSPGAPPPLQEIYCKFHRLRTTIHGILFMRRSRESNPIDFELQSYFVPNRAILYREPYDIILAEATEVFSPWKEKNYNAYR